MSTPKIDRDNKIDRDRIFRLDNTRFVRYSSYERIDKTELGMPAWGYVEEIENGSSASYSDFHDEKHNNEVTHIMPELMSGGDYSGSTVTKSNYLSFKEGFGEDEYSDEGFDCGFVDVYGGHGTYAIAISVQWLLDEKNYEQANEMLEALEGLSDYPLLNDDHLSQFETELTDEEWSCWACGDYQRYLEKKFDCDIDLQNEDMEQDFREVFEEIREHLNIYWEAEQTGASMHVDVEKIAGETEFEDIEQFIG